MLEDKAKLERIVGISLKEKKAPTQGLSRRSFGKAVILGVAALGGYNLLRALEERQEAGSEIFTDGFFGLFEGTIHVRKDAVIYDRPSAWTRYETERPFTTKPREDTQTEVIAEEEQFSVQSPILFLDRLTNFRYRNTFLKWGNLARKEI